MNSYNKMLGFTMYSFNDNLDVLDDKPIKITAKVSLVKTEEGGRHTPVVGGIPFRPNHNFGNAENRNFYIGQINFKKDDVVKPGEERTVEIVFLNVKGLKELLRIGTEWRIQEGPTLIAMGEALKIET